MITTPEWGYVVTLDTIMQYGQDLTAVQFDYRVTRSLTMCRYYYLLRMLRSDGL